MVGDNIDSDKKGALQVGITPILYNPQAQDEKIIINGVEVIVLKKMRDLLQYFNI